MKTLRNASRRFVRMASRLVIDGRRPARIDRARSRPALEAMEDRRLLTGYFQGPVASAFAGNVTSVESADFNRDGRPDVVTLSDAGVQVLLNNGSGGFSNPKILSPDAGFTARSIAVGDMDRDGQPDVVVTSTDGASLRVHTYRNLNLAFAPAAHTPLPFAAGPAIASVVGDFDRDGNPDVAIAFTTTGMTTTSLALLTGDGDGTFTGAPPADTVAGIDPTAMVTADFNRDGAPDVAIIDSAGVSIKLNTSNPANPFPFAAPTPISAGTNPRAVATGDFNRDGISDLAVASDSGVTVLLGDGLGGFPTTAAVPLGTTPAAKGVGVVDYNRDGLPDLVSFGSDGQLKVLTNTGAPSATGLFGSLASFGAGSNANALAVADVNSDSLGDVIVGSTGTANNLNVLPGGIDTSGPRIVASTLNLKGGTLTLQIQDNASGILQSGLSNLANYKLNLTGRKVPVSLAFIGVTVTPATTPNGVQTVTLSFSPLNQRILRNVKTVTITVLSAGITDRATNRLDGLYNNAFPSGNGLAPPSDFVQVINAKKKK